MKLLEILHTVEDEQKSNLINVDEWKFADSEHLKDMGFELEGDYHYKLDNPPMTVYQQKSPQVQEGQKGSFFVIDEPKKGKRAFRNFDEVIQYFDNYKQPDLKPGLEGD